MRKEMMNKYFKIAPLFALIAIGCNKSTANYSNFLLGLGGEGVPVGQYSSQILKHFEIDEEVLKERGHISYGDNVKAVTTAVKQGLVGAGLIYKTDAFSANLKVIDVATKEMCDQVIYPVAVLKNSKNLDTAKSFLNYLRNELAMVRFEAVGFTGMNKITTAYSEVFVNDVTLNVYAAASMTESLNAVINDFKVIASNVTINANYGSSGTLLKQIQEGANCDIFLSAAQKQMNTLEEASMLEEGTRINLLENQVALSVPENNPYSINNFSDLVNILKEITK